MDDIFRKTIEGWIDQASGQLQAAKDFSRSTYRSADAIQASQQCIELSVKSVLSMLNIKYPKSHQWAADKEPFVAIAKQIKDSNLLVKLEKHYLNHSIPLPRLLLLMNFWGQLYLVSKYGFETEFLASAQQIFKPKEAKLAVQHADECLHAANALRYIEKEKLSAILSE